MSETIIDTIKGRFQVDQIHDLLGGQWSKQSIVKWITTGVFGRKLPAVKVLGRYYVDLRDLEEFLSLAGQDENELEDKPGILLSQSAPDVTQADL